MITKKQYPVGKHILTFEWDEDEHNVAKQPTNNLYIEDIWSMKDIPKCDDLCTGCWVDDEDTFRFTTFIGLHYTMKVHGDTIEVIAKSCVK